jgi:hypothetical protein
MKNAPEIFYEGRAHPQTDTAMEMAVSAFLP